jgi:hypothetical protein
MPLTASAVLFLLCLAWLQQIDDWRNTRPILECLGQLRGLNSCLFCELGNALRNRQHACDLLGRQLELPYRCRQQALAGSIQCIGWSWPAACFCRACDQLLVGFTTPPVPVGQALLGTGVGGFHHEIGCECRLERGRRCQALIASGVQRHAR